MTTVAKTVKGKSPYQKYDKKPYKYSPQYQAWRNSLSAKGPNHPDTVEADKNWYRMMGMVRPRVIPAVDISLGMMHDTHA